MVGIGRSSIGLQIRRLLVIVIQNANSELSLNEGEERAITRFRSLRSIARGLVRHTSMERMRLSGKCDIHLLQHLRNETVYNPAT